MTVDTSIIVAVAALAGSVVGACASVATTFVAQRTQGRWARFAAEMDEHQELYGKFVEEAIPLFMDAVQQPAIDPPKLMRLFSIIGRIRLESSDEVLHAAEHVGARLLETYQRQPEDFRKLLQEVASAKRTLDRLREFTEACRRERANVLQSMNNAYWAKARSRGSATIAKARVIPNPEANGNSADRLHDEHSRAVAAKGV